MLELHWVYFLRGLIQMTKAEREKEGKINRDSVQRDGKMIERRTYLDI